MKKFAILGLFMLMTAGAQQRPAQAPPMSPEMQKEMEARTKAVEPGPEHARLMKLAGDFTTNKRSEVRSWQRRARQGHSRSTGCIPA